MNPLSFGIALLGGLILGGISDAVGALIGGALGYLIGEVVGLNKRLNRLESKMLNPPDLSVEETAADNAPFLPPTNSDEKMEPAPCLEPSEMLPGLQQTERTKKEPAPSSRTGVLPASLPPQDQSGDAVERSWVPLLLKQLFQGGNLMVRVGVVILFFGIAFLVKYAADRNLMPIELRLTAVALFAMGLTGIGWYLRLNRSGYAVALQGGGVGILYLTVFGAAKLYDLFPLMAALGLMIALVLFSTLLALLQSSSSLAVLGIIGGFLAPILTSSGSGNHIMLFSYYLLLNIGILAVAWFKAWRELNLVGFLFTFGIGTAWGISAYRPEHLSSTEPFLILFFLVYFAVSILFALRQPVNLKGYVDGTLVFGLPLAAFGLQSRLVGRIEFGLALSAVVLAALYIFTAIFLWHRQRDHLRLLIEAFLALGVMFITLAIPLALNGYWTSGTWALEGGALFWVGIRQDRLIARLGALGLQAGAALAVLYLLFSNPHQSIAVSGGLVALSGFWVSYLIYSGSGRLKQWEIRLAPIVLAWALIWWLGCGLYDIHLRFAYPKESQVNIIFIAVSLVLFNRVGLKLSWPQLRYLGMSLLPFMILLAMYAFEHRIKADPFRQGWWIVWLLNFFAFYDLLRTNERFWPPQLSRYYHIAGWLLFLFLLTWDLSYWSDFFINTTETWPFVVWGVVPGLNALGLLIGGHILGWPVRFNRDLYRHKAVAVILLFLLFWCLKGFFIKGDPDPLPYYPLLNPIDLTTIFFLLLVFHWNHRFHTQALIKKWMLPQGVKVALMGIFGCLWLSSLVIRSVHFWTEVPYDAPSLATSSLVQASLSILWSLYAMGILMVSTKKGFREGWIAGAGLMAIVVIKLFLIDLSGSGTIARIVSFVAVGILMLIIGYFSPLPPSVKKENSLL